MYSFCSVDTNRDLHGTLGQRVRHHSLSFYQLIGVEFNGGIRLTFIRPTS